MRLREICKQIPDMVNALSTEQLDYIRRDLEQLDPTGSYSSAAASAIEAELASRFVSA